MLHKHSPQTKIKFDLHLQKLDCLRCAFSPLIPQIVKTECGRKWIIADCIYFLFVKGKLNSRSQMCPEVSCRSLRGVSDCDLITSWLQIRCDLSATDSRLRAQFLSAVWNHLSSCNHRAHGHSQTLVFWAKTQHWPSSSLCSVCSQRQAGGSSQDPLWWCRGLCATCSISPPPN